MVKIKAGSKKGGIGFPFVTTYHHNEKDYENCEQTMENERATFNQDKSAKRVLKTPSMVSYCKKIN